MPRRKTHDPASLSCLLPPGDSQSLAQIAREVFHEFGVYVEGVNKETKRRLAIGEVGEWKAHIPTLALAVSDLDKTHPLISAVMRRHSSAFRSSKYARKWRSQKSTQSREVNSRLA